MKKKLFVATTGITTPAAVKTVLRSSLFISVLITVFTQCRRNDIPHISNYPADVANAWMQLHIALTKTTTGYNSVISDRSFAYAGITLYESIAPAVPGSMIFAIPNWRHPYSSPEKQGANIFGLLH